MIAEGSWKKHRRPFQKNDPTFPRCWGAICTLPKPSRKRKWLPFSILAACLLASSGAVFLCSRSEKTEFPAVPASSEVAVPVRQAVRDNSAVVYRYPEDGAQEQVTFTREQLLRGKLMLIDDDHPLPDDAPAPNTFCIAANGKGVIPVRDLTLKSSPDTISALYSFFYDARQKGIEGLAVYRATLSGAEQRSWQLERTRVYSASLSLSEAAQLAQSEIPDPGRSEHQQGYTVDIRLFTSWNGPADERPLARCDQGRYLLQNAWRYGFVRRYANQESNEDRAYQFRYVGVAHSTAMTYLDLELDAYLELLH